MPAHHEDEGELRRLVTEPPDAARRVSSFMALVSDARRVAWRDETSGDLLGAPAERPGHGAIWAGGVLYLMLVDQIGSCFVNPDRPTAADNRAFFFGLRSFADPVPDPAELFALYALRCSFVHIYSAANVGKAGKKEDRDALHHRFRLLWEPDTAMVGGLNDPIRWDGKFNPATSSARITTVNLYAVEGMVEQMVKTVQQAVRDHGGRALSTETWLEFFTQYTFETSDRPSRTIGDTSGSAPISFSTTLSTWSPAASGVPGDYNDRWMDSLACNASTRGLIST